MQWKAWKIAAMTPCALFAPFGHAASSRPPAWLDTAGAPLERASFLFSGFAQKQERREVESEILTLLLSTGSYPANATLKRPAACRVGSRLIADTHVELVKEGQALRLDSSFVVADGKPMTLRLRFSAEALAGKAVGAVSCDAPGRLRYSY